MVANELTIYIATNISFLATKKFWFSRHNRDFISLRWGSITVIYAHLISSRNPYWKIFASKTLNIRKKSIHPFSSLYWFRHMGKLPNGWPCLNSPYNALQTLGHWLRHVCLCIVLLTCKEPSYLAIILVSGDQKFAFSDYFFYQLLSIGPFPKKLAPKTSLQGPLWPSSKIFLAETLSENEHKVYSCLLNLQSTLSKTDTGVRESRFRGTSNSETVKHKALTACNKRTELMTCFYALDHRIG